MSAQRLNMGIGSRPGLGPKWCLIPSHNRVVGPTTNRGRPLLGHPRRISQESWSVSGRNSQPAPLQPGRHDEAVSLVSFWVGQTSPPDGCGASEFPSRHRQGVHADQLPHEGVLEKSIPDGKWKAEADRLLPLLRHYKRKRRDRVESRLKTFGCDACVWGLPHQECLPWACPPETHEGQLSLNGPIT